MTEIQEAWHVPHTLNTTFLNLVDALEAVYDDAVFAKGTGERVIETTTRFIDTELTTITLRFKGDEPKLYQIERVQIK
jgi:hypothetical protein